jgi:hypothetical protein
MKSLLYILADIGIAVGLSTLIVIVVYCAARLVRVMRWWK